MPEYLDTHTAGVVNRLDELLAKVDDAVLDWELTREFHNLTDEMVAEGAIILKEARDAARTTHSK